MFVRGRAVVADQEGYLHWLSADDGRIVARVHAVGGPVSAPLVLRDDVLYVLDTAGKIAAIDTRSELQVGRLARLRSLDPDAEGRQDLERLVRLTVSGIAAGLQVTG